MPGRNGPHAIPERVWRRGAVLTTEGVPRPYRRGTRIVANGPITIRGTGGRRARSIARKPRSSDRARQPPAAGTRGRLDASTDAVERARRVARPARRRRRGSPRGRARCEPPGVGTARPFARSIPRRRDGGNCRAASQDVTRSCRSMGSSAPSAAWVGSGYSPVDHAGAVASVAVRQRSKHDDGDVRPGRCRLRQQLQSAICGRSASRGSRGRRRRLWSRPKRLKGRTDPA